MDIEKFNPTVAELQQLATETKQVDCDDLRNETQVSLVNDARKKLQKARVAITKKGKELRQEALDFQRAVIAREKELIGIIEPEEQRLLAIGNEADRIKLMDERKQKLPERRASLTSIDDHATEPTDEELLAMDDDAFTAYRNARVALAHEIEQKLIEEERLAEEREAEKARIAEEARKEALAKAEVDKAYAEARHKREMAEVEERARKQAEAVRLEADRKEKERKDAEKKAEAERKRIERMKEYRAWRAAHGWTEETKEEYQEITKDGTVTLYKKLGVFNITD
jgi:hypothetical protein